MNETMVNQQEKTPKLSEKQMAYVLLRKQGMDIASSARATGYNPNYAYRLEKKLKSYDLTDDFWLSKASKVLKNIMDGKPWGKIEEIKGSTALEAVRMIFDRHQPVVRKQENFNINADLGFVDLSKYRVGLEPPRTEGSIYGFSDKDVPTPAPCGGSKENIPPSQGKVEPIPSPS